MSGEIIDFPTGKKVEPPPLATRPRGRFCGCKNFELDTGARRVYCADCEKEVPAFDALVTFTREFEQWQDMVARAKNDARRYQAELDQVKRDLKNAKARMRQIPKAWR